MDASIGRKSSENNWSSLFSHRKFIDDIPSDIRNKLCTEIDYTIHQNEGYWQKIVARLGFDETQSKKFLISFQMNRSPTDELLRDCSHRMIRIRHLYNVFNEVGLVQLSQELLGTFDTEEELPNFPPYLINYESYSFPSISRSNYEHINRNQINFVNRRTNQESEFSEFKSAGSWTGIDTYHFCYDQIQKGTNNFSESMTLGAGAFGTVYKVILNNTLFACKVLKVDKENSLTSSIIETHRQNDDLRNELNYLSEYRHPNVIALYGWSLDGQDPCLIYDFMVNGSLQDRLQCLNGTAALSWELRLKISCDAARGLQFLHNLKNKPLIHGDIKTANILLDKSFTAKLGDFGLAREMPKTSSTGSYIKLSNLHTPGTLGYLANEYLNTKKLSAEVDTYAFGVVLLEVYTGRRAYERYKEIQLLRDYVYDIALESEDEKTEEKLFHLQDPQTSKLSYLLSSRFIHLALKCCHEKRKKRPKMSEVFDELEAIDKKQTTKDTEASSDMTLLNHQFSDLHSFSSENICNSKKQSVTTTSNKKFSSHANSNKFDKQLFYNSSQATTSNFNHSVYSDKYLKASSTKRSEKNQTDNHDCDFKQEDSDKNDVEMYKKESEELKSRVCINPFKESLLDKLKDGQTYTMIFRDQNQSAKQKEPSVEDKS